MGLIDPDSAYHGGPAAVRTILAHLWWGRPIFLMSLLPGVRQLFDAGYRWVAKHRHCHGGACAIGARPSDPQSVGATSPMAKGDTA